MPRIFYDAFAAGLVPVQVVDDDYIGAARVRVLTLQVLAGRPGYPKGDIIHEVPHSSVVVKTRRRGIHQLVRTATDAEIDSNRRPA